MPIVKINYGPNEKLCECNSWFEHWKNGTSIKDEVICAQFECEEKNNLIGTHVLRVWPNPTGKHFVIPLCKNHNKISIGEIIEIKNITLVSTNILETCGFD